MPVAKYLQYVVCICCAYAEMGQCVQWEKWHTLIIMLFALTVYQLNTSNRYFRSVRVPLYGGSVPVAMICHLFVLIALSQTGHDMELAFPLKVAH